MYPSTSMFALSPLVEHGAPPTIAHVPALARPNEAQIWFLPSSVWSSVPQNADRACSLTALAVVSSFFHDRYSNAPVMRVSKPGVAWVYDTMPRWPRSVDE